MLNSLNDTVTNTHTIASLHQRMCVCVSTAHWYCVVLSAFGIECEEPMAQTHKSNSSSTTTPPPPTRPWSTDDEDDADEVDDDDLHVFRLHFSLL